MRQWNTIKRKPIKQTRVLKKTLGHKLMVFVRDKV